ncbi:MAG: DUF4838 domain-containing protein [Victivallales bacterium]|nr:DUF4838 domain-containing protein [Victivallales bacterium]
MTCVKWMPILLAFCGMAMGAPCLIMATGKTEAETTAVELLEEYLGKLTGGSMDVTVAGRTPVTFRLDIEPAIAQGRDGWRISTKESVVTLSGSNGRSVLHAVSHFLEDDCGVWFFNPHEELVPEAHALTLPSLHASGIPFFGYRHVFRGETRQEDGGRFAALRRLNNDDGGRITHRFGGCVGFGPPRFVHTMWSYVPEEMHFEAHPEYFALVDGVRRAGRESQLCFSNRELPDVIYRQLMTYVAQGERKPNRPFFYDISINDNGNYCHCGTCTELVRKHGHSGALLHLLNPIARKLRETHPDLWITTLAYDFTREAPREIVPEKNIIVRLCPNINQAASLLDSDNADFLRQLTTWAKACQNLFVWDYAETYTKGGIGMPFASELHYADRYRLYAENGVKGIMWEHPFEHDADMFELKFHLETRLMEDPYADAAQLTRRFMRAYYGPAAPHILESRRLLDVSRLRSGAYIRFMSTPEEFQFSTAEELREMQDCYDRAEVSVSSSPLLLSRVRRARRGLDRLCVFRAIPQAHRKANETHEFDINLAQAALARLRESWCAWLERYPNAPRLQMEARHELAQYEMALASNNRPPSRFAGREIYDWRAMHFQNHEPKAISLVRDAESENGYAMRITVSANPQMYNPPFEMGFRDRSAKTTVNVILTSFPQESGYHWHRLGAFTLPKTADVFLSRSWCVKLHLARMQEKRPLEFWVSMKFTGSLFRQGDTAENAIYIDRIVGLPQE